METEHKPIEIEKYARRRFEISRRRIVRLWVYIGLITFVVVVSIVRFLILSKSEHGFVTSNLHPVYSVRVISSPIQTQETSLYMFQPMCECIIHASRFIKVYVYACDLARTILLLLLSLFTDRSNIVVWSDPASKQPSNIIMSLSWRDNLTFGVNV